MRPATLLKSSLRRRFPVYFVKILRIRFWKATVSQNMKAFKLQMTSYKFCETNDWLNPHYD